MALAQMLFNDLEPFANVRLPLPRILEVQVHRLFPPAVKPETWLGRSDRCQLVRTLDRSMPQSRFRERPSQATGGPMTNTTGGGADVVGCGVGYPHRLATAVRRSRRRAAASIPVFCGGWDRYCMALLAGLRSRVGEQYLPCCLRQPRLPHQDAAF